MASDATQGKGARPRYQRDLRRIYERSIPTFVPTTRWKQSDGEESTDTESQVSGLQPTEQNRRFLHPDLRRHQPDPARGDQQAPAGVALLDAGRPGVLRADDPRPV